MNLSATRGVIPSWGIFTQSDVGKLHKKLCSERFSTSANDRLLSKCINVAYVVKEMDFCSTVDGKMCAQLPSL